MGIGRSYLYVPGDREDVLAKAASRGADALIIDLEDSVVPARKAHAREVVAEFLRHAPGTPALWVRINPGEAGLADLDATIAPAVVGICLAKTESASDVAAVAAAIGDLEHARGLAPGSVAIAALLESAAAVTRMAQIVVAPRVTRVQLGEADLAADLGVDPSADGRELLWVRSQAVLTSAAAGIDPPLAPVSTDFRDLDTLRESTVALKRLGYRGRACIHPAQVGVVNDVFTPSAAEVAQAEEILAGHEAALAAGDGVFVDSAGRMVDAAVVRAARMVVSMIR